MIEKIIEIHLDQVDSTNKWAKDNYRNLDLSQFTRITADEQTAGYGRFNRFWLSPKGLNIYLTYFFTLNKDKANLNNLTQILSLSITKLLHKKGLTSQIKWPNDILIKDKKIAGILCETIDLGEKYGIILGAGINVNMPRKLLSSINQPATSFKLETGKTYQREELIKILEEFFFSDFQRYIKEGFTPFYKTYESLLKDKGKIITLKQYQHSVTGILHSLNSDGRLNLLLSSGDIKTFSSGEIE